MLAAFLLDAVRCPERPSLDLRTPVAATHHQILSRERVLHTLADCGVRGAKDPASACARRAVRTASLVQARGLCASVPSFL